MEKLNLPKVTFVSAKKRAIEFAEWLRQNWRTHSLYGNDLHYNKWRKFQDNTQYTTEELYEFFLKSDYYRNKYGALAVTPKG